VELSATAGNDGNLVVYRLDGDDRITYVNPNWRSFAEANGCTTLEPRNVLGRSLWDFIHDGETCHFHQMLLGRAKAIGKPIRIPFRCDGPDLRRFMEMEICLCEPDSVEYRCTTLHTERRSPVEILAANLPRTDKLIRVCSWCKCVDAGGNTWVEIEEGIRRLSLFDHAQLPAITHTMCDHCFARLEQD